MSIRVRTIEGDDHRFEKADDFTVDFDSGVLSVKKTDDRGNAQAIFAVYAGGQWSAVFNDDDQEDDQEDED